MDQAEDWVLDVLRVPWDPDGTLQHRLEGKSNLMGEGLSATWASLGHSQDPAHKEDMDYIYKGGSYTRLGLDGKAFGLTW